MEIKIFGKSLFSVSDKGSQYIQLASNEVKQSKYLPDFYTAHNSDNSMPYAYAVEVGTLTSATDAVVSKIKKGKTKPVEAPKPKLTPKAVHELKLLHDESFQLNVDPAYVDEQLSDFKDKLGLLTSEEYDMQRGIQEIASIVVRLENRKKYETYKTFFEEFPYTTSSRIDEVVKAHDYLKLGKVAQFVADMPKEALETMKNYNKHTDKLCGKQAVFYIVADKKDFEKSDKRRDPILLAQSPFGHFWQILGAWDKEMLFLEEL